MGTFTPISLEDYPYFFPLAVSSNLKTSLEFLLLHGCKLTTDINIPLQRDRDCFLMEDLRSVVESPEHSSLINKCRLYLWALFLSDIVDGSGQAILEDAWCEHTCLEVLKGTLQGT